MYICLDIGSVYSGVVKVHEGRIIYAEKIKNKELLKISVEKTDSILIEQFDSVHGSIGLTTVAAIFWTGRIFQYFSERCMFVHAIGRKECLKSLGCKKDKDVISYIREQKPYGIKLKADCWQAYALYLAYKNE